MNIKKTLLSQSKKVFSTSSCTRIFITFHQPVQSRSYAKQSKGSFVASTNVHTSFPVAAVFGATGFVGRYIVNELSQAGYQVITPYRNSEFDVLDHKVMGDVGQIIGMRFSKDKYDTILDICARSNIVVNAIGRVNQLKFDCSFHESNVEVPQLIAKASYETNVDRLFHISQVGADLKHPSEYMRMKAKSEIAVKEEFPEATIMRSCEVYGTEDKYFNHILRRSKPNAFWGVPLVRQGQALRQPLFVGNLADAIVQGIVKTESIGKTYELGGPKKIQYNEIIKYLATLSNQNYTVTNWPLPAAYLMGIGNEIRTWNKPTFTRDYITRLLYDIVVPERKDVLTFKDLEVEPVPMEECCPSLFRKYRKDPFYNLKNNYEFLEHTKKE